MSNNYYNNCQNITNRARDIAILRKTEVCRKAKGVADTNSMLLLGYKHDFVGVENTLKGNPIDHLPQILSNIAQAGFIYWHNLTFITEAFMRTNLERFDIGKYEHGDLEKDYKENPLSEVIEGFAISTITWEGDSLTQFTPFGYDDKGRPEFQEVFAPTTPEGFETLARIGGRGIEILKSFANYCREELDSAEGRVYVEAVKELIEEKGLRDAIAYLSEIRSKSDDDNPNLN